MVLVNKFIYLSNKSLNEKNENTLSRQYMNPWYGISIKSVFRTQSNIYDEACRKKSEKLCPLHLR